MTIEQMNSAINHSWFLCQGVDLDGKLFVRAKAKSYEWTEETIDFTDFAELTAYVAG